MKTRNMVSSAAALFLLCSCSVSHRGPGAPKPISPAQPEGGRAVSLKVLQQKLREGATGAERDDLLALCGLRRIDAVVSDPKSDDIVLVGSTHGPVPLHTEDLVIALRCAFQLYVEQNGSVRYYTAPGVTIDPNPKVMAALDRLMAETVPGQPGRLEAYQQIARSLQAVRILGMPDCRAASVAVDCDYHLKRLSNGTVPPPVPGLESLFDLRAKPFREHPFDTRRAGSNSMDRFWFCGGKAHFLEDSGVVQLRSAPVVLLTESEFLSRGSIHGSGHPDPLAAQWASRFSARFDAIAARDVRYRELANLYHMFAIGDILRARAAEFRTESVLAYFLGDFSVPTVSVPRQLPGLTRVEEKSPSRQTASGIEISYWSHTSCGGVDLTSSLLREHDRSGGAHTLAVRSLAARPFLLALFWPLAFIQ